MTKKDWIRFLSVIKDKGVQVEFAKLVIIIVFAFILSPFLIIWVVNTLFNMQNPYDFIHWLAGFSLILMLRFSVHGKTT